MKTSSFINHGLLIQVILTLGLILVSMNCRKINVDQKHVFQTNKDSVKKEIEYVLNRELELFYPLCLDTAYGGYNNDINYKWQLEESPQNKMIVSQARHVWSLSNAVLFYPERKEKYFIYASQGYKFLRDFMWDKQSGGFYTLVDRSGKPIAEDGETSKEAYGNAFAIYALAAYYKAFGDTSALGLAKRAFYWMEKHSYDPVFGGYFQFMQNDGTPYPKGYGKTPPKDQNSSIHIMECFTELYGVWHDPLLKERLGSMLKIIRDTIVTQKGYMNLFFKQDWTHVSYQDSSSTVQNSNWYYDHVSFGHDIETAYLLLEASDKLGIKNDSITLRIAKKMVDHSINNGWDKEFGGIFDGGYYFKGSENNIKIVIDTKEFWTQVETLNSLLIMSQLFPEELNTYFNKFLLEWDYIKKYQWDNEYGGWYLGGIDKAPDMKYMEKANIWKADYHTTRGMINCLRRLESDSTKKN